MNRMHPQYEIIDDLDTASVMVGLNAKIDEQYNLLTHRTNKVKEDCLKLALQSYLNREPKASDFQHLSFHELNNTIGSYKKAVYYQSEFIGTIEDDYGINNRAVNDYDAPYKYTVKFYPKAL
jgi:hypothetical protein